MKNKSLKEACGVFGVYSNKPYKIAYDIQFGLFALQHRGEESAGLAVSTETGIISYRNMGSVPNVLNERILKGFPSSNIAIGHVRYSTTGSSHVVNAQPLVYSGRAGEMALGHNGNIFNSDKIRNNLMKKNVLFQTSVDSEVIAALINNHYNGNLAEAIISASCFLKGSYAIVMMDNKSLIAVRDPSGLRPLVMGKTQEGNIVVASETPALDVVGATFTRDIEAGEIVVINQEGIKSYKTKCNNVKKGICSFEYVYFARNDSIMDGLAVYDARVKAGELLALNHSIDADIVAPIPDTAAIAASSYSKCAGIPYIDVLSKNRYIGRSFIQPDQTMREKTVRMKLSAIRDNVEGKRIVLIDDSIVRGTTGKKIVAMLKEAGAKEVHFRITSPPVKHACYFGIDIQNEDELIAAKHTETEIAQILGCDSVEYLSIAELAEMCAGANYDICTGCFSGKYPMDVSSDSIDKLRME